MSRARDLANLGDGIDTSSITSGTFVDARIPNLSASKITSGQFEDGRIAITNVTQHEGSIDALASNPTVTLGSNATFPAGHVVQTNYYGYNSADSNFIVTDTPTAFTQSGTTNKQYKATISGLTSGNDVLVIMSFQAYLYRAASTAGCTFHILRDSDSTPVFNNPSSGNKRAQWAYVEIPGNDKDVSEISTASVITMVYIDESPTSTSHTYYAGASTDSSTYIYLNAANTYNFTSVIQEIQQ